MELIDTHCHIHEASADFAGQSETRDRWQKAGDLSPETMISAAIEHGVTRFICVGTTLEDSNSAVRFAQSRPNCWASIGIHPHETKRHDNGKIKSELESLAEKSKVVAVGECGLDYFYNHSPKISQENMLRFQIELALDHHLPLIFHVREAFSDFCPIFDSYKGIRGVVHSFSAGPTELEEILSRNLYIGLNGIMTFTKDPKQLDAVRDVPLDRLLIETDAPFLTPVPYRGTICEPKYVRTTAQFLANLRGETLRSFANATTQNARYLFGLT